MMLAVLAWVLLSLGLTYIAVESLIFEQVRIRLVRWLPALAGLLSCKHCSSFWTGQIAATVVLAFLQPVWYYWTCLPLTGIAAVGLVELLKLETNNDSPS